MKQQQQKSLVNTNFTDNNMKLLLFKVYQTFCMVQTDVNQICSNCTECTSLLTESAIKVAHAFTCQRPL